MDELEKPKTPVMRAIDKFKNCSSAILVFRLALAIGMCGILWVYTFGHYSLLQTWACFAGDETNIASISY